MPRALIVGGTGVVGAATARRLLAAAWDVDLTGRNLAHVPRDLAEAGATFVQADRQQPAQMRAAYGAGADLLVDCVCYTAADATRLLPLMRDAGATVMISSKAVYVDSAGNHANSETAPRFDGPVRENQPTVAAGGGDLTTPEGYGPNKVAAEQVCLDSGAPVTVLRPSKVHGPGGTRPREWVFVKRVLDGRPAVLLANRGGGVDHTTAAANLAALIETVAAKPGRRILNSADPYAPSALEIARMIAEHLGHEWEEVLLEPGAAGALGRHPWDVPHPIVLDTSAAVALGYEPVGGYAETVVDEIDWLVRAARDRAADLDRLDAPTSSRCSTTRPKTAIWRAERRPAARAPSQNPPIWGVGRK